MLLQGHALKLCLCNDKTIQLNQKRILSSKQTGTPVCLDHFFLFQHINLINFSLFT